MPASDPQEPQVHSDTAREKKTVRIRLKFLNPFSSQKLSIWLNFAKIRHCGIVIEQLTMKRRRFAWWVRTYMMVAWNALSVEIGWLTTATPYSRWSGTSTSKDEFMALNFASRCVRRMTLLMAFRNATDVIQPLLKYHTWKRIHVSVR